MTPSADPGGSPSSAPADSSFALAVERTRLAHERTLAAWLRTAMAMISFGFTIYKFFQLENEKSALAPRHRWLGPREFALMLIGTGLVALVMATFQHRSSMVRLRSETGATIVPISIATVVSALFSIFGVLAFVAVLFRE